MIEVDVTRRLGRFELATRFSTDARGIVALFGRSGSGKTSVVNAIAGTLRPDRGRIRIGDEVLFDSAAGIDVPIERRGIGYVFQDSRLFPHLGVEGNLRFGLKRARGRPAHVGFDRVVDLLGLRPLLAARPASLSGGERQRVALGRALLAQPRLLLMDEPLAALDQARKAEILPYIEELRDAFGLPIVYVSHAIEEVVRLAEHVVLLSDGRVRAAGPTETIMADPDLQPAVGRFEAGGVLNCIVDGHDDEYGISVLAFDGGELRVPRIAAAPGSALRVRIRARDVMLALSRPIDVSASNQIAVRITRLIERPETFVDVELATVRGNARLLALLTRESVARLALEPGLTVWALVKSVALDARTLGLTRPERAAEPDPGWSAPDPSAAPARAR